MFPGVRDVLVGYGSAGLTMKSSGKGEVAVPTTGAFKACTRVFGKKSTSVTDEFRSTAIGWETGGRKEAVYRQVVSQETVLAKDKNDPTKTKVRFNCRVHHISGKMMPVVPEAEKALVEAYLQAMKEKRKLRRCGGVTPKPRQEMQDDEVEEKKVRALRYPEVRGLRFCPERRKYFDRDRTAALTIARLRTTELLGTARPAPFHRSFDIPETPVAIGIARLQLLGGSEAAQPPVRKMR